MHIARYDVDPDFIYDVEEYCPHCDNMIAVNVDEKLQHLETVCPVCGKKLMICSSCDRNCDWGEAGCCMDRAHCATIRAKDVMDILQARRYSRPQNDFQRTTNRVLDEIARMVQDLVLEGSDA